MAVLKAIKLAILSIVFLSAVWAALKPLASGITTGGQTSREGLLRAVALEPSNPAYHYLLGVYFQHETGKRDLDRAMGSFAKAIALNPARPEYWLGLADVLDEKGDPKASDVAMARAVALDPEGIRTRWALFTRHLGRGHADDAVGELRAIIADYPSEREKAFNIGLAMGGEGALEAMPRDAKVMTEYFLFLVRTGDTATLMRLWERLASMPGVDRDVRMRYADYMLSEGRTDEAMREWLIYRGGGGEGNGNLAWDGGFEKRLLGLGFDWRLKEAEGVRIFLDREDRWEGTRSLAIAFDGTRNVDFYHVSQVVPLNGPGRYRLGAVVSGDDITSDSGVFIEFSGMHGCAFSGRTHEVKGSSPWREVAIEVVVPKGCGIGAIRVRRPGSQRLDGRIKGVFRLDDVSVEKLS